VLDIDTPRQLARLLETPVARLYAVVHRAESFYEELVLCDPGKPHKKPRMVVSPQGQMRTLQRRLYRCVLAPRLARSPYSHGGVPGRNVLTNVREHIGQPFLFTADIADFYPSIHWTRVSRLFIDLNCSLDVARICARICTYKNCLSQGLLTSPILADQLMRPVDDRIAAACHKLDATYTRLVDDLAVSAPFDLEASGIPALVFKILRGHGLAAHPAKQFFGPADARASITNIRFHRGHPDVRKEYVEEVLRQLNDAVNLVRGDPFQGPYFTEGQLWGRVQFIIWVNPNRRRSLLHRFAKIDWSKHVAEACRLGLAASRKTLQKAVSSE
jgi:RNA-directed DNA polymerase